MLPIDEPKLKIPEPEFLNNLNKEQKSAVLNTEGPLLVLSGAGTGKTALMIAKTGYEIKIVAISAKNKNKKRKFKIDKSIFFLNPLKN